MRIFIFLILIFIGACSSTGKATNQNSCNCDELQLDVLYNHFFKKNRKEPYTGLCFKLNKKGDTIETINYNKGKIEGVLTKFFESGQKLSETNFEKNKHHGDYFEWNEKGELIFHGIYIRGTFDTTLVNKR